MLIAARVAPLTRHIGIVPTAVVTHTEPFHVSKAIATLDYVSSGRAGVRVQVSRRPDEAALFGRRTIPRPACSTTPTPAALADLFDEAADYVEVVRRLWDSWEDDAEIRDAATGRFVDRDKLHYIDFEGAQFSVKGPSITPRPPQGQPVVAALAHRDVAVPARRPVRRPRVRHAARRGRRRGSSWRRSAPSRTPRAAAARPCTCFGDLVVFLDDDRRPRPRTARSGSTSCSGTSTSATRGSSSARPAQLADLLAGVAAPPA